MDFAWEDPPPAVPLPALEPIDHEAVARVLTGDPDRWLRIGSGALVHYGGLRRIAESIRDGGPRFYRPAGRFLAAIRIVGGEVRIYAKRLGGDPPA